MGRQGGQRGGRADCSADRRAMQGQNDGEDTRLSRAARDATMPAAAQAVSTRSKRVTSTSDCGVANFRRDLSKRRRLSGTSSSWPFVVSRTSSQCNEYPQTDVLNAAELAPDSIPRSWSRPPRRRGTRLRAGRPGVRNARECRHSDWDTDSNDLEKSCTQTSRRSSAAKPRTAPKLASADAQRSDESSHLEQSSSGDAGATRAGAQSPISRSALVLSLESA